MTEYQTSGETTAALEWLKGVAGIDDNYIARWSGARPALTAAIDYMRPADMLTVQEVDRLGRNPWKDSSYSTTCSPAASP
jgi:DNA invertase Pin-like site-specific DNA recombinase